MICFFGNDHAGIDIKPAIIEMLTQKGIEVINLGTDTKDSVDYPDFAKSVGAKVLETPDSFGVLMCGTGLGISIAANKVHGIRAALCHDSYTAQMAREHNDANVLCFGARVVGLGTIESIIDGWLNSSFAGGRHQKRVDKIE